MKPLHLVLLALVVGCRSAEEGLTVPVPEYRVDTAGAPDPETARRIAELIEQYEPAVRAFNGSERETPRVWMIEEPRVEGVYYGAKARWMIVLGTDARGSLSNVVVHELAHWHSFSDLDFPYLVEEGLAVWVESRVLGIPRLDVEILDRGRDWWSPLLARTRESVKPLDEDPSKALYVFGWWLVDTIGFDELRAMHAAGRTSAADVIAAAGLAVDPAAEPSGGGRPAFRFYESVDPDEDLRAARHADVFLSAGGPREAD